MRTIKRDKYYYLQHSYREKGKVITKEKYLGTEIPLSLEQQKLELRQEEQKALHQKLKKIKEEFQKEWKRAPESAKQREMQEIAIAFTYHTNAIEGSTITLEETREIIADQVAPNKPLRDVRETEAHARVFLEMLETPDKISKELLLKWHQDIFGETKADIAGRFRDFGIRVGMYRAPDWQDVEKLMKGFFQFLIQKEIHSVELAARAHYRFEMIHPFGDGNGRIGRLIMNHILWHHGYLMLIIEYAKRHSYYRALQKGEEGFVRYFMQRYLRAHQKKAK
ncbi:MAG TPA: Fic family protein [Candidatus Nanoarchaeia archaeon]|nr:Fic family protein [Candidatus Nanoarchaeia archaeon]